MKLIIVESPTKAKTLSKFLGGDYEITATMGHLRDLPESGIGVEVVPDSGNQHINLYQFIPTYEALSKKKETISKLKKLAIKADQIILATDPDREGEAIAWHVSALLRGNSKSQVPNSNYARIAFHEITQSAIEEALKNPRTLDLNLVDAQQARRILDRLVGYKLSPVLWRKIRRGLSAGRVQSVTVRLIVEREVEIKAFKPVEYWTIEAELTPQRHPRVGGDPASFLATLVSINEKKAEIHNKTEADQIVTQLQNCEYKVKEIEKSDLRKYPYPPFTTSTLQQAASNLFGWAAKQTMRVAQSLYESGLITYHRTDSLNLAAAAVSSCREFIKKEYGEKYLPESPKLYKTKSKVAQEAHEAIRPTNVSPSPERRGSGGAGGEVLGIEEAKLYSLIWKRFVSCQMNEAVYEQTKITILAKAIEDGHVIASPKGVAISTSENGEIASSPAPRNDGNTFLLRTTGSVLKFDGWRRLYVNNETMEQLNNEQSTTLPPLSIGELLNLLKLIPSQHFTEPPARYTEASLIKALEELGIGRPSTYAPIISTIQERQYVLKEEKKFSPTALGITVNDFLVKNFSKELDYQFTARMEDSLDEIANGEKQWQPVLSEFYGPFIKTVDTVIKEGERVKVPVETTDQKCDKCGAAMVIRIGRFGKFLACSRFPDCKNAKPLVSKTDLKCPKDGGEIVIRKTKRGRKFFGCSNYPKCDFAAWKKEDVIKGVRLAPETSRGESKGLSKATP